MYIYIYNLSDFNRLYPEGYMDTLTPKDTGALAIGGRKQNARPSCAADELDLAIMSNKIIALRNHIHTMLVVGISKHHHGGWYRGLRT